MRWDEEQKGTTESVSSVKGLWYDLRSTLLCFDVSNGSGAFWMVDQHVQCYSQATSQLQR